MQRYRAKLLFLTSLAAVIALGALWLADARGGYGASQPNTAPALGAVDLSLTPKPKVASNRLETRLLGLVAAQQAYGEPGLEVMARSMAVPLERGAVRVIAEANPAEVDALASRASSLGIRVEAIYRNLVQLLAPVAMLDTLARDPGAGLIRLPLRPLPGDLVTGKGVSVIGATDWHEAGFTGAGTNLAVLDVGFEGYASLLGTELPESVVVHSCRADGDITGGGERHGTAVAEVAHEAAPDAQLYLANFDTEVELANCVDWLVQQGVAIVNVSVGYVGSGPGDGTGVINEIVDGAIERGVLWVNAAGNEAQAHWLGPWADADGDDLLNYVGADETNHIDARAGERIELVLKWDDPFEASCNDYDLYLLNPALEIVAASEGPQDFCTSGLPSSPVEVISYLVPATGRYHAVVSRFEGDGLATFHFYSLRHGCPVLEHCVKSGSIVEPADNPGVLAVGAVPWNEPDAIEDFSSRGPTDDGRTKPDLAAPDGVSNITFGAFYGTSASAPHTAAAAALVKQWQHDWSAEQIRSFLLSRAVDLGESGADNVFGAGRLDMGLPKPTPTPTATSTPTFTPTPTATPTPRRVPGDVNCDNRVTSPDAALVLQRHARLAAALPCPHNADVNQDGNIDSIDATLILSFVAGLLGRL